MKSALWSIGKYVLAALLLYVIVAKALHVEELSQLMRMVGGRFGRGPQGSPAR